jgi:ferrous iron transport protein A
MAERREDMLLFKAQPGQTGQIKSISGSEKIRRFLFTLGCFEGEEITLISVLAGNYIINIKDSRYAIDKGMAKSIELA